MGFKYPSSQRKPYTVSGVEEAPTGIGVYGIFNSNDECIYIGMTEDTDGIRGRMRDHYNGTSHDAYCINRQNSPSYFLWDDEIDCGSDVPKREKELTKEYKNKGEAFCNDRVG